MQWITRVNFNEQGLIPVIAQDWQSERVLMVAWMTFCSRSNKLAASLAIRVAKVASIRS